MNAITPHNIEVRQVPFEFDDTIDPIWNPTKPEWSHMLNGASITMPYLEPFLIRTMREAMNEVTDPGLKQDMRDFIGQEGQHYQTHRRYNEILKAKGYDDLAITEQEMEADYVRFKSKSLRWKVAYSAGFETMTMGITEWLINDRVFLFAGADTRIASFAIWHMVEETEHKSVAFDLYQTLYGDYLMRAWGLLYGSYHVAKYSRRGYIRMLKKDGSWRSLRSRLRLYRMVFGFFTQAVPVMLKSLLPGYHPDKVTDPEWVKKWMESYNDLAEGDAPYLDTKSPTIPPTFA